MKIRSAGDFLRVVKELYPDGGKAFFRGESSSKRHVSSSIFRFIEKNQPDRPYETYGYQLSNKIFSEFKNNLPIYPENNHLRDYRPNDLDLIMMAQHYGAPTRLIDWTKNPLVALFFATEFDRESEKISIYMLRSRKNGRVAVLSSQAFLNSVTQEQKRFKDFYSYFERSIFQNGVLSQDSMHELNDIANRYVSSDAAFPAVQVHPKFSCAYDFSMNLSRLIIGREVKCNSILSLIQEDMVNFLSGICSVNIYGDVNYIIEPLPINLRIKNQQGVFLFSKDINEPAFQQEYFNEKNIILSHDPDEAKKIKVDEDIVRIDIEREFSRKIHEEINLYGLTRDFIYPELMSFSKEMPLRVVKDMNS